MYGNDDGHDHMMAFKDSDFDDELAALGFDVGDNKPKQKKQTVAPKHLTEEPPQKSAHAQEEVPIDIATNIGDFGTGEVAELTEEDMNDETLLAEFAELGFDDETVPAQVPGAAATVASAQVPAQTQPMNIIPSDSISDVPVPEQTPQPKTISKLTTNPPRAAVIPSGDFSHAMKMAEQCQQRRDEAGLAAWLTYAERLQGMKPSSVASSNNKTVTPMVAAGGYMASKNETASSVAAMTPGAAAAVPMLSLPTANTSPYGSCVQAKDVARRLQAAGRKAEVPAWVRYAKEQFVEEQQAKLQSTSTLSVPHGAHSTVSVAVGNYDSSGGVVDAYTPLEDALKEACTTCLDEIRVLRNESAAAQIASKAATMSSAVDTRAVKDKLLEYKKYTQDLNALRSRRAMAPQPFPPLFNWESVQVRSEYENMSIGLDSLRVTVHSIRDMAALIKGHSRKTVTVQYDVGIPKESAAIGRVPGEVGLSSSGGVHAEINHSAEHSFGRRSKALALQVARKYVTFVVSVPATFFLSAKVLGYAVCPLRDLATVCDVSTVVCPIMESDPNEGSRSAQKNNKCIGGDLVVSLSVRRPFEVDKEVRVSEVRRLVIDPKSWNNFPQTFAAAPIPTAIPAPTAAPGPAAASEPPRGSESSSADLPVTWTAEVSTPPQPPAISSSVGIAESIPASSVAVTSTPATGSATASSPLTDLERKDPLGVQFIESSEVFDYELQLCDDQLVKLGQSGGADRDSLLMRRQLLQMKSDALVTQVQSEQLSLEDYLKILRERIQRDTMIALYFKDKPCGNDPEEAKANKNVALQVMRRITMMKKEVASVE